MTNKIFIDTNVFLDYFLIREPHCEASAKILTMVAHEQIVAIVKNFSNSN